MLSDEYPVCFHDTQLFYLFIYLSMYLTLILFENLLTNNCFNDVQQIFNKPFPMITFCVEYSQDLSHDTSQTSSVKTLEQ